MTGSSCEAATNAVPVAPATAAVGCGCSTAAEISVVGTVEAPVEAEVRRMGSEVG